MPDGGNDWFNQLEPAESSKSAAPAPAIQQPAQTPGTPTIVVRPQGQNATSGFASSPDWFSKLEPAESKSAPSAPSGPAWAPGGRNVSLPASAAKQTPDLPEWAGGGTQPQAEPPPAAPEQKPSWSNLGGAVPSGLYEGVARIPNIPTDITNMASRGIKGLTGFDYGQMQEPVNTNPMGYQPVGGIAQGVHDASSAASNTLAMGGVARAITPLLPAGSTAATVSRAVESPSAGTVAAAGAGGAAEEPIAKEVPQEYQPLARLGANLGVGGLTAGAESLAGNATRSSISPETAQLAQLGRDTYNIPITAAQMSGNRMVKTADSVLKSIPFSGHGDLDHEVQTAVNSAVSRTFGEDAPRITPAVMANARARIGGVLQDVEARNPVNFDHQTVNDLADIESNARSSLTDPEYSVIRRQLDGVLTNLQPNDQIAGTTYGSLMHKGAPLDAAANSKNPNISQYAGDIKDALRGSLQRSLTGDDAAAYQQARTQWKNMKTVEPLTQSADVVGGASPSTGDINPTLLRAVVNKSYKDVPYRAPGEIPLNDIADIAQRFLKETPTSHTSERGWMLHMLSGLGGAAFEGGGIPSAGTALAAGGGLLTSAGLARGASKALQSDALANRMIRQGMGAPGPRAADAAVPLITSAGVRQLEPPQQSTNPTTGLPQFSLKSKQLDLKRQLADQIVGGIKDGSLASPEALKSYITQNRRDIRSILGGQAMGNIQLVHAMLRRPSNLMSVVSNAPSQGVQDAMNSVGISDAHGLASLAITSPELAKLLATNTSRTNLTKPGEAQLIAGIQRAGGQGAIPDDGAASVRPGVPGRSGVGQVRAMGGAQGQAPMAAMEGASR